MLWNMTVRGSVDEVVVKLAVSPLNTGCKMKKQLVEMYASAIG